MFVLAACTIFHFYLRRGWRAGGKIAKTREHLVGFYYDADYGSQRVNAIYLVFLLTNLNNTLSNVSLGLIFK